MEKLLKLKVYWVMKIGAATDKITGKVMALKRLTAPAPSIFAAS